MEFTALWESARAVLGWAVLGDETDREIAQLRRTYEKVGWFRQENVILLRTEGNRDISQKMPLEAVNIAVLSGFLTSSMEEVDALTSGTRVSVVPGDDSLGVWRTNGAHAGIILDRIGAGELDPHPDLLRCLLGTPASAQRLALIDLEAVAEKAGPGRVPTEEERLARLSPALLLDERRIQARVALEQGDEERGMELMDEWQRLLNESMEKRQQEFPGQFPSTGT